MSICGPLQDHNLAMILDSIQFTLDVLNPPHIIKRLYAHQALSILRLNSILNISSVIGAFLVDIESNLEEHFQ